ncbi:MAG: IclR family transcriptional regulator [Rhodoglobus sp.]
MTPGSSSAILKGLSVLDAVLAHERLTDIAEATGLSPSTAHRILSELVAAGWVSQDSSRHYRPGRHMHAIGGLLSGDDAVINREARPALESLREATGFTVHFGLTKDDVIMYAAKLDGLGSYRMKSRLGVVVPMYSTSIGKAVLSTYPEQHVAQICRRIGMRPVTPATHTTVIALLEDLAGCRQQGFAIDDGENEPGLRCVGAPVFDASGRAIGGVSVSALDFELPVSRTAEIAAHVKRAAAQISSNLGGASVDAAAQH